MYKHSNNCMLMLNYIALHALYDCILKRKIEILFLIIHVLDYEKYVG